MEPRQTKIETEPFDGYLYHYKCAYLVALLYYTLQVTPSDAENPEKFRSTTK